MTAKMMTLDEFNRRYADICEFKHPHDPVAAERHLKDWIKACGGPDVTVKVVRNWKEAARAASTASAARAASTASAARAARAASTASAARDARAASAARDARDASAARAAKAARDARDARAAWAAWDVTWSLAILAGAIELADVSTIAQRDHLRLAAESGVWLVWIGETEVWYAPSPIIHHVAGTPHDESGPAFVSLDLTLWFIDGIEVDEQIVMTPESQTIDQIHRDDNADRRAIRIARYGWPRYLRDSKARCLDSRDNAIEGTVEALYDAPDGSRRLVATCPTGRVFAMGCPAEVSTCEAAAAWLSPRRFRVLART